MKKSYVTLIVIALIVLVAVITNPNSDRHKEVVKREINAYMQKRMSNSESGAMGQAFDALLGGALIDKMVDNIVSTDNYLVFSTTRITWEGNSRVIGFGAFGNVFITGQVKDAIAR